MKSLDKKTDEELIALIKEAGKKKGQSESMADTRVTVSMKESEREILRNGIDDLLFKSDSQGARYFMLIGLKAKGYL